MQIIGHGIDLVETDRIAHLLDEYGQRFLTRCFTEAEASYAAHRRRQIEHLAGRFAAKEAILKVLGTGWRDGIAWTDAEIIRLPSGQPFVVLHGMCKQLAGQWGSTSGRSVLATLGLMRWPVRSGARLTSQLNIGRSH